MGKDQDLLHAVKEQDIAALHKILNKSKSSKSKLIGSSKKLNVNFQDNDGMAALHQAALVGNTEIMQVLLESGAAVDVKDSKGMRPLHYAAWQGKSKPVTLLLQWGANVNGPALDGETPLHLACQHGHYDVVNMLLGQHGDPTIFNNLHKTPLDLACEFGRYRVCELLLNSNLCNRLLLDQPDDMVDNHRTTCLHLAAKNGHSDIIRLLLQAGVDINRQTLQGTCLHEAALYGKTEVVKLLLDCGVDVNKPNSYDQTALDIVNKFTTSRAAKELKQLLKEASFAVQARAVQDYCNIYDPSTIAFKEGDYIKVLEQRADGMWKGYVMQQDGHMAKPGLFPASTVVLVDRQGSYQSGGGKSLTPPDLITRSQHYNSSNHINDKRTSSNAYGTIGADDSFPPPPSPLVMPKSPAKDRSEFRDSGISPQHHQAPFPFPGQQQVYYSGRQHSPNSPERTSEWLGRHLVDGDMRSASPSKDSPTSSNRNSSSSTGSGGSALGHNYVNIQITQQHRLSGQSYESGVSSRQSYHSTSSSSLGSLDRLEESGYSSTINVHELFQAGLSQDKEILHAWLVDLHFEEYYNLFMQACYDMPTISRMTPEDLTAIGITKPAHRKRLKAEIAKLHIHDGIPDYKPNDLGEWLRLLNLEQYEETLMHQGYDNIDYITDITWEDLEEIGIKKLGHQKKIMLAIDRLKRIESGLKRLSSLERQGSKELLEPPPPAHPHIPPRWMGGEPDRSSTGTPLSPAQYGQEVAITTRPKQGSSGDNINGAGTPELRTFQHQPMDGSQSPVPEIVHLRHNKQAVMYQPDVVAIQVSRTLPRSSTSEGILENDSSFRYPSFQADSLHRSYDGSASDGEYVIAERGSTPDDLDGMATLRRPSARVSPRIAPKPKPIAKIVAKSKRASREVLSDTVHSDVCESGIKSGTLTKSMSSYNQSEHIYEKPAEVVRQPGSPGSPARGGVQVPAGANHYAVSQMKSRKPPPPPPKRTNSIKENMGKGLLPEKGTESPGSRTPPSVPAKPQQPPKPQQEAFAGCVKSLAQRFGSQDLPAPPKHDYTPSRQEDFPPPPPPISSQGNVNMAPSVESESLENVIEKLERKSASKKKEHEGNSESDREKGKQDSASSFDGNASTSSIDSNTLPFANENVGTIKQRNPSSKPSIVTVSTGDEDSDKSVNLNTSFFEDTGTMKRAKPPATSPKPSSAGAEARSQPGTPQHSATGTPKKVPPPTPKRRDSIPLGEAAAAAAAMTAANFTDDDGAKRSTETGDVLNDIGNMLQDLTDELDAMLEFELQ